MEELEIRTGPTVNGWLRRVSQHRRTLLICLLVGWLIVVGAGWILPAKYKSETLILVEQQKVPEHYVEANIAVDLQQRLQSMSEQILSRTRLMGIIDKFHLYGVDHSPSQMQGIVERMRKDINIDLVRASSDQITAFKITYSADSPLVAQQVTSELTSLFIEENLHNRQQMSEDTTDFLENQLDSARKNLDAQELRLREFKSRYLGQLPEQTGTNVQILGGLQNRLQSANDALNQAEQQKLYFQSLLNQYRALQPAGSGDPAKGGSQTTLSSALQKLQQLKAQLEELKAKYTPRHPDVVRLEQEVAAAQATVSKLQAEKGKGDNPGSHSDALVTPEDLQAATPMLQVQSQLKAVEFEIANRRSEIKEVEAQIDLYQSRLNSAPAREQELAAITRDHEQSRAYYESLLAKRNQSEMATNLEKRQQGEQFRMIDPPSLAQKPYFPNRLLFSIGGIAFGLILGVGLVVVHEFASPKIFGEGELGTLVEAQNIVLMPPVLTLGETRDRWFSRMFDGAVAAVIAITIPITTLFLYFKG